jgi:hypothetical protein
MNTTKHNLEIVNYAINELGNINEGIYACDLHNELFNRDYFIIGNYAAQKWLSDNVGVFKAIDEIKEYEQFNFGEVATDLSSPEKVANMYAYIKGEELLNDIFILQQKSNEGLTAEDIEEIKKQLYTLL